MTWLFVAGFILLSVGALMGLIAASIFHASKDPYDGSILVEKRSDGSILYTLEIDGDLDALQHKDEITLKVAPASLDRE